LQQGAGNSVSNAFIIGGETEVTVIPPGEVCNSGGAFDDDGGENPNEWDQSQDQAESDEECGIPVGCLAALREGFESDYFKWTVFLLSFCEVGEGGVGVGAVVNCNL